MGIERDAEIMELVHAVSAQTKGIAVPGDFNFQGTIGRTEAPKRELPEANSYNGFYCII